MDRRSPSNYSRWFAETYPELSGHGVWLRGGEINTLPYDEFDRRAFRALFVRLSTYADVASSFTHRCLYHIAASIPDIYPDLSYLPPEADARVFERDRIPWLIGTQSHRGPDAFHLIGFSNAILQELINIPAFLATSGIPLSRRERLGRADIPLIILGGANAPFTSSIWGEDSLVDGIFIGQDTEAIRDILRQCAGGYAQGADKAALVARLAQIPGFYDAARPEKRARAPGQAPCRIEQVTNGIVPYTEDAVGSGHLQLSEGCRANCSFCAENWTRKPYREAPLETLRDEALRMKAGMGLEKIDLYSFNFNMHSRFYDLLWDLLPLFSAVGLKSQRLDMLTQDPAMIECQAACGKTSFSAGVEGISPRLRRYLNKNLSEAALRKAIELIFKAGARELKVFLLSTGLEEAGDYAAFDAFLETMRQAKERYSAGTRVICSVTPLVKFPWTPLAFDRAHPKEAHDAAIAEIRRRTAAAGFEAREAMGTKEYMISQILARTDDARGLPALLAAVREAGFVYYRSVSPAFFASFMKQFRALPGLVDAAMDAAPDGDRARAWDALDTGIERELLRDIFLKNRSFTETGTGLDTIRVSPPVHTPQAYRLRAQDAQKAAVPVRIRMSVSERGRGLTRRYPATALARALMLADPSLAPFFRSCAASYWQGSSDAPVWLTGDDIMTISWGPDAAKLLAKRCAQKPFIADVNRHLEGWGVFRGLAPDAPETFRLTALSPFPLAADGYFKARGLKHTLTKNAAKTVSTLVFTKDALKKDIVRECSFAAREGGIEMSIAPGRKFSADEFMREAFACPGKHDWVRVGLHAAAA